MAHFLTSESIYNRLKTDSSFISSKAIITYFDSTKNEYIDIPLIQWIPIKKGGEIPWHRVYYFKYDGKIIWDRKNKICSISKMHDSNPQLSIRNLSSTFKVITFNVMSDIYEKKITDMSKRKKDLIHYIEKSNANIICLQEIDHTNFGIELEDKLKNKYDIAKTNIGKNDIYILSKSTIINFGFIKFNPQKHALWIDILSDYGRSIRVYGVHLTSDSSQNSKFKRELQLQLINKNLDYSKDFIILGDFNYDEDKLPIVSAIDAWSFLDNIDNHNYQYTYDPDNNKYANQLGITNTKKRIDRILFNGFLEPTKIYVDQIELSDHYPLICDFITKEFTSVNSVKYNNTGLCAILPYKKWLPFYEYRDKYDKEFSISMQCINILLPFAGDIDEHIESIDNIVSNILPINVSIVGIDNFEHQSTFVLFAKLDDESTKKFQQIYVLICSKLSIFPIEYKPYIKLGEFVSKDEMERSCTLMNTINLGIKIDSLHFITKEKSDYYIVKNIVGKKIYDMENLKEIFENMSVFLGGSSVFDELSAEDYDVLVVGNMERSHFFDKFNKCLQTCGYFTNVRHISNDYTEYFKLQSGTNYFDIHYCYTKSTLGCTIDWLNSLRDIDSKSEHGLSIVTASSYIKNIMSYDINFIDNLNTIKCHAKKCRIYGQYGYIPGLAWAVLVAYFMKSSEYNSESFVESFCKFYSDYDFDKQINLVDKYVLTKYDKHMKIIRPVSPYGNICRTMTYSTMVRTIECFKTVFNPTFYIETKIIIKANTIDKLNMFIAWFNTFYTKLILNFEKIKIRIIPLDSWTILKDQDKYVGHFGFCSFDKLSMQTNLLHKIVQKTYEMFDDIDISIV